MPSSINYIRYGIIIISMVHVHNFIFDAMCLIVMQLSSQERSRKEYGKGVEEILVKRDDSLPNFVAAV